MAEEQRKNIPEKNVGERNVGERGERTGGTEARGTTGQQTGGVGPTGNIGQTGGVGQTGGMTGTTGTRPGQTGGGQQMGQQFRCAECNQNFGSQNELNSHMSSTHGPNR